MPKLHHFTLDPYGRRLRLALAEYGVEPQLTEERPWQPSTQLAQLNPSGLSPVYIEESGLAICGPEASRCCQVRPWHGRKFAGLWRGLM